MKELFFNLLLSSFLLFPLFESGAVSHKDSTNQLRRNKFIALDYQAGRVLPIDDFGIVSTPQTSVFYFQDYPYLYPGHYFVLQRYREGQIVYTEYF